MGLCQLAPSTYTAAVPRTRLQLRRPVDRAQCTRELPVRARWTHPSGGVSTSAPSHPPVDKFWPSAVVWRRVELIMSSAAQHAPLAGRPVERSACRRNCPRDLARISIQIDTFSFCARVCRKRCQPCDVQHYAGEQLSSPSMFAEELPLVGCRGVCTGQCDQLALESSES